MAKRPNIVYVMPDEWRPDAFGFTGNAIIQTPHVDALAGRGAGFSNAYCESPVCMASRASLVTGKYAADHGLQDNSWLPWAAGAGFPAADFTRTLPQRLQDAGYYTAEVGKMHFRGPRYRGDHDEARPGLGRRMQAMSGRGGDLRDAAAMTAAYGFDEVYEEGDKPALAMLDSGYTEHLRSKGLLDAWRERLRSSGLGLGSPRAEVLEPEDMLDGYIGRRACDFIRAYERDQPFFLWVGFVGPHPPLDAPELYSGRYDPASIPLGPIEHPSLPDNRWGEYLRWNDEHLGHARLREQHFRAMGKFYYGNCTLIDDQVGEILRVLRERGMDEDTWFLFGSDHGELLGDHGMVSKRVFYRTSVQVPCIVVPPGGLDARIRVDGLVQGFDLPATMLDVAGARTEGYDGRSLRPALDGADVSRRAAFSEIAGFLMVATAEHKLVLYSATLEPQWMVDLARDPDELTDVLPDPSYRGVVEELMERFAKPFLAGDRNAGV